MCGAPITLPGNALHGKFYVRMDISCSAFIEIPYYGVALFRVDRY